MNQQKFRVDRENTRPWWECTNVPFVYMVHHIWCITSGASPLVQHLQWCITDSPTTIISNIIVVADVILFSMMYNMWCLTWFGDDLKAIYWKYWSDDGQTNKQTNRISTCRLDPSGRRGRVKRPKLCLTCLKTVKENQTENSNIHVVLYINNILCKTFQSCIAESNWLQSCKTLLPRLYQNMQYIISKFSTEGALSNRFNENIPTIQHLPNCMFQCNVKPPK